MTGEQNSKFEHDIRNKFEYSIEGKFETICIRIASRHVSTISA